MARKVGGPFSTGNMRPLLVSSADRVDLWSLQRQRCDGRTTSILPGSGRTAIEGLSRLRTTNLVGPGKSGDAQSRIPPRSLFLRGSCARNVAPPTPDGDFVRDPAS
jgi:hypothetical protein